MEEQYLTLLDLVITPLYVLALVLLAKYHRNKYYPVGNPLRQYYLPGLLVKVAGAIFIGCIYQFYYGSGDTLTYFRYAKMVNGSLSDSFQTWWHLILRVPPEQDPHVYAYSSQIFFYDDPATYMVVRITAILGLLNFTSYMPIATLFAFISFSGMWAMYRTFVAVYPALHKQLAVAFLFVPGVVVWGSGIFKDTICMFGLGWMTYTCFRIFVNRDLSVRNFLLFAGSLYLVGSVKIYILLAFVPSLALWLLLTHSSKIKIASLRVATVLFVTGAILGAFVFFAGRFSKELNQYSLEKLNNTLEVTRNYIVLTSGEEGSSYDLGEVDGSVGGLLKKFPAAVVVTLFRPFLWEANKPIVALSALEGSVLLLLFLQVFIRTGFLETFKKIFQSPNLAFFFIYSVIFAFAVGISTGNFGALSRYKIPCIPFFTALIVILLYSPKINKASRSSAVKKGAETVPKLSV